MLADRSINVYVRPKVNGLLPVSFGTAVATAPAGTWAGDWSGGNAAGFGVVGTSAHGVTISGPYLPFSGTANEFSFYSGRTLATMWTDGTSISGNVIVRQTDVVNNVSGSSNVVKVP